MDVHGRQPQGDPEGPGPSAVPPSVDLDYVMMRASRVWGPDAARTWIASPNAFLGGARPMEVLKRDGVTRLVEVLDAEMWGGAA